MRPLILSAVLWGCASGQPQMQVGSELGQSESLRPDRSADVNSRALDGDEEDPLLAELIDEEDVDSEDPDNDDPGASPAGPTRPLGRAEQRQADRQHALAERRRRLLGVKPDRTEAADEEDASEERDE